VLHYLLIEGKEKHSVMKVSIFLLTVVLSPVVKAVDDSAKGPPPFFLQDPADSLCLHGEDFKRCSIETLFHVVGTPGKYQIRKRSVDGDDNESDGMCLAKKDCKDTHKIQETRLAKCSHCGAKEWNILGDAETGFVVTANDGKTCLMRDGVKAKTGPCDDPEHPYVPLQLQFASASDIVAMSSLAARLIGAASDGDKKTIQTLLKDGVDVNVRDWDDLTALIPAASSGHLDICKLLVKEGIDVNAKDKDGITALMEASIMGHTKIVEFLLDSGAELDATANSEVTALWLASGEGRVPVMKILLNKGADATNTRVDGITALMTASVGGHEEAVKLLLENGADASATDGDGLTPLINAAENGTVAVMKLLVHSVEDPVQYVNSVSSTGFTALIIAAAHGHSPAIEYLLNVGADANAAHENGVNALMYAAAGGHTEAMKLLIEKGKVDVNVRHSNGGTAFMEASTGGHLEAMKLLIDNGALIDFIDTDGVTPLMAVASLGFLEAQTLILDTLKKKMSKKELTDHINMLSVSGGSSVMFAAAGGHASCAKQLIELGAEINKRSEATPEYLVKVKQQMEDGTYPEPDPHVDGVTALHVAAQGGHLECVNLLIDSGADVTILDEENRTALMLAVKNNHADTAIALLKAGADPNTVYTDEEGQEHNLLMDAITVENEEFAKLLAEKGADLYYVDEKKVTTLLQASHRGLTDIVQILLEKHAAGGKGGYLDDASDEGITPLIAAASEGHSKIVEALIAAGANVVATDKDGTSALMAASARGHVDAAKALLEAGAKVNEQNIDGHTALMFAYNGKNQVETLWERYSHLVSDSDKGDTGEADDAGTGPLIKEALANHNALVELLLQKGADPNLKDKEGHTAKDFDFHPDADAEVLKKEANAEKARDGSGNEL
jgi:serine/threonine-protein phosphatase 6 regulatory ankyrin repeat subunit B